MKKAKRLSLASILLAFMFLLSACGGGDGDSSGTGGNSQKPATGGSNASVVKTGRWIETDITPEDANEGERLFSFTTANGDLVCYSENLATRWTSSDGGESWQKSDGAKEPVSTMVQTCIMLEDGRLVASLVDYESSAMGRLITVLPDGTTEDLPLPEFDEMAANGGNPYVQMLKATGGSRMFISFYDAGQMGMYMNPEDDGNDDENSDEPSEGADGESPEIGTAGAAEPEDTPEGGQDGEPGEDDGDDEDGDKMVFSSDGESKALLYDVESGKTIRDMQDDYMRGFYCDGEYFYCLDFSGTIKAYNAETGEYSHDATQFDVDTDDFNMSMALGGGSGSLLISDGSSIYQSTGAEWQLLVSGAGFAFSAYSTAMDGLSLMDDGAVTLNLRTMEGSRILRYHYDENAEISSDEYLSIWSLVDHPKVRAAITELYSQNPGIYVDYETALSAGGGVTADDALKKLNSRLIAGDAPDIIILDGCPIESYVDKGVLKELSEIADLSDVYKNLLASAQMGGGTYFVPGNFSIPVLFGGSQISTLQELAAKVEEMPGKPSFSADTDDPFKAIDKKERPALMFDDFNEMFGYLWKTSAGEIIKNNTLDTAALESFLTTVKAISDKYGMFEPLSGDEMSFGMAIGSSGGSVMTGSITNYLMNMSAMGIMDVDDLSNLKYLERESEDDGAISAFPGLAQGTWLPKTNAAISAGAQNEELAVKFIESLLSANVQGQRLGGGLPVTRGGADKMIADIDAMYRDGMMYNPDEENEGFTFDYDSLVTLAKTPYFNEDIVTEMVREPAENYCAGEIELNEAVEKIEQSLKNYLAERQ